MIKLVTYICVFIALVITCAALMDMTIGAVITGCIFLVPFCALRR